MPGIMKFVLRGRRQTIPYPSGFDLSERTLELTVYNDRLRTVIRKALENLRSERWVVRVASLILFGYGWFIESVTIYQRLFYIISIVVLLFSAIRIHVIASAEVTPATATPKTSTESVEPATETNDDSKEK